MDLDVNSYAKEALLFPPLAPQYYKAGHKFKLWKYSINGHVSGEYDYKTAQALLEYTYIISFHNTAADRGYPNLIPLTPRYFPDKMPLNTMVKNKSINVGWVFYSKQLNMIVVAMSATYNTATLELDFLYRQVYPRGLAGAEDTTRVHEGFWTLYSGVQDQLLKLIMDWSNARTQILITGISLGGATSTLAMQDISLRYPNQTVHYSFASPRLFNIPAQEIFDTHVFATHRIVNGSDIVPTLPLPIMPTVGNCLPDLFIHVKGQHYFDLNLGTYYHNHVDAYLHRYRVPAF